MNQPNPKSHFQISMVKSVLRIAAAFCLALGANVSAGAVFIVAEILGIIEEMV